MVNTDTTVIHVTIARVATLSIGHIVLSGITVAVVDTIFAAILVVAVVVTGRLRARICV